MRTRVFVFAFLLVIAVARPGFGGDLQGRILDRSGGVLPGASIHLLNLVTAEEFMTKADAAGQYRFANLPPGTYRIVVTRQGFSEGSRTIVMADAVNRATVDFSLEFGTLKAEVTVAAARGVRDVATVPLRADTLTAETMRRLAAPGTGDLLLHAPGITPVGSGPFQVRPRLRGLDSTRVLVLVDGERLNNARTATDRAGIEVGLIDRYSIEGIEVLGGAGSVLYGTDALSGTINILTTRPRYSNRRQYTIGFDGFYSSNDNGRRGAVTLGVSDRRWAVTFTGGGERFDDYRAGRGYAESTASLFADGRLRQVDTADQLGFSFRAFPDPFNAPFTRTTDVVPRSGMAASAFHFAGAVQLTASQELRVRYQRRHAANIGFPDFEPPFFFQTISLPFSRLDKVSASYSVLNVTPWLSKLTVSSYFQTQDRLLRNEFPVQFPAPTARVFFPVNIFRLEIVSDTRQQVSTPGVDVQANFQLRPNNMLTAGVSMFRDRSEDERTTVTETTLIGNIALGPRGPAPNVFPAAVPLGLPSTAHPARVPNASFSNVALFIQDEWDVSPFLRLTGGLRIDNYRVVTDPTPGYSVASLVGGATPAIDPATLPDINGDRISRTALTGEAGVVLWPSRPVNLFAHYVRSYRHPNLEELLFSGPATVGNIVPNVKVEPETGHNVDVGVRFRSRRLVGSLSYFNNHYDGFISTEIVATSPAGSISQAINFSEVRIQGVEAQGDAPFVAAGLAWAPHASVAWTRGTVLAGTNPLSGLPLAGAPQDNITPWKIAGGIRVSDPRERWWAEYGVRAATDVTRISPLLSESPFLIAQDLLALSGFAIHRMAAGYDWRKGNQRLGLTLAVDNLADRFYREHFQFAPARGRSVSLLLHIRGLE